MSDLGQNLAFIKQSPHAFDKYKRKAKDKCQGITFKSGSVVLNSSQIQIVVPTFCVFIYGVMLLLQNTQLIRVQSPDRRKCKSSIECKSNYCKIVSVQ